MKSSVRVLLVTLALLLTLAVSALPAAADDFGPAFFCDAQGYTNCTDTNNPALAEDTFSCEGTVRNIASCRNLLTGESAPYCVFMVLLLVAGIYQVTPLKHACLSKCRSPLGFVLNEWREGRWGALLMGLKHGSYCTGCCWSLMALLFVAGVMNLVWVAAIAGFILLEKLAPAGQRMGQAAGILMIAGGVMLLGLTLWGGMQPEMNPGTESEPGMESKPEMSPM